MGLLYKQNRIKLDILESLARSQRALARMIESMADVAEASEKTAGQLLIHMETIGNYQRTIMEKLTGIRIANVRRSPPAKPWINRKIAVCSGGVLPKKRGCPQSTLGLPNKHE